MRLMRELGTGWTAEKVWLRKLEREAPTADTSKHSSKQNSLTTNILMTFVPLKQSRVVESACTARGNTGICTSFVLALMPPG
jgi:hypothetical protein